MVIDRLEQALGFEFPEAHRKDFAATSSEIHKACEFLLPDGPGGLDILRENQRLREDSWQGWSEKYIAFATQGCGDWSAYDLSHKPYRIIYVDPIERLEDAAAKEGEDCLVFESYDEWKRQTIETHHEVMQDFADLEKPWWKFW